MNNAIKAYANDGRWVAGCPRCKSALRVKIFGSLKYTRNFKCGECGYKSPVEFPDKLLAIEAALLRRQYPAWRNWLPGMSVRELLLGEPFLHFSWTAPRTWVLGETLTAALLNTHLRDNLLATSVATAAAQSDIMYATAANALARLAKGTAYQLLGMNTGATAPYWLPYFQDVVTTEVEVVSTDSDTTVLTYAVPAGTLGTNNILGIDVFASWLQNGGGTDELVWKLKYGATTVATTNTQTVASSATRRPQHVAGYLKGDAATNAQKGSLVVTTTGVATYGGEGTAAIDSTAAQNLILSVTHGISSATASLILKMAIITYFPNI